MPDVPPVKALYTPHIQFRLIGWLRAALLYWEGILRFAPDRFSAFDPPEVHELVAAGLIENVSPERYCKAAADVFCARLDEVLASSRRPPCLGTNADPLIHASQIDRDLLQKLQRRGLAASSGDWAKMSPDMAALYKATLREHRRSRAQRSADDGRHVVRRVGLLRIPEARAGHVAGGAGGRLRVRSPAPAVPVDRDDGDPHDRESAEDPPQLVDAAAHVP